MKNNFLFLLFFTLIISCQDTKNSDKKESSISSTIEIEKEEELTNPLQTTNNEKALYKALKKKSPLTNDQLFAVLPKDINGNKPIADYALKVSSQLASGMYEPIGKKGYNFFIEDGVGSRVVVRNFFDAYKIRSQGPPETEYIHSERDGYKTIAFLQPNINRNDIRFVYNNRFRITLEGPDDADVLWSYIDFENLKKLDQYK